MALTCTHASMREPIRDLKHAKRARSLSALAPYLQALEHVALFRASRFTKDHAPEHVDRFCANVPTVSCVQ